MTMLDQNKPGPVWHLRVLLVPIAYVSLFGFGYPSEELLRLMIVPPLIAQIPAVAWAEIAARQRL